MVELAYNDEASCGAWGTPGAQTDGIQRSATDRLGK